MEKNRRRGKHESEYELIDTGVFNEDRYFDVEVEYAKADPEDILIRITVSNRGPEAATLDILPTVWFRNIWSWHPNGQPPSLAQVAGRGTAIALDEPMYGRRWLHCDADPSGQAPQLLFTDNETNTARLFGYDGGTPYTKDAFHRYLIDGEQAAVNPESRGTKGAALYRLNVPAGGRAALRLRLTDAAPSDAAPFGAGFEAVFERRVREADEFYAPSCRRRFRPMRARSRGRRSPGCSGRSSTTTTS